MEGEKEFGGDGYHGYEMLGDELWRVGCVFRISVLVVFEIHRNHSIEEFPGRWSKASYGYEELLLLMSSRVSFPAPPLLSDSLFLCFKHSCWNESPAVLTLSQNLHFISSHELWRQRSHLDTSLTWTVAYHKILIGVLLLVCFVCS
jgi:hypothetical protein